MRPSALFSTLVLLLGGCASDSFVWCPPGESETSLECRNGLSWREWEATKRAWEDAAAKRARALPVDFNDLILALYTSSPLKISEPYCLVVFGERPEAGLVSQLRQAGANPVRCRGANVTREYVEDIRKVSDSTYQVVTSTDCGSGCAGGAQYIIEAKEARFEVTDAKLLWRS
jgi:hypothetical protein